ncbi:MAG: hypothetical protein LQ345_002655 [Seirophora villosa]|nr:MAG: hypothetical protein LQ345_002655 [Seirophora villosa]
MVYENCLVIPGVIMPYPSEREKEVEAMDTKCGKPTVTLLQRTDRFFRHITTSFSYKEIPPKDRRQVHKKLRPEMPLEYPPDDLTQKMITDYAFKELCDEQLTMVLDIQCLGNLITTSFDLEGPENHWPVDV